MIFEAHGKTDIWEFNGQISPLLNKHFWHKSLKVCYWSVVPKICTEREYFAVKQYILVSKMTVRLSSTPMEITINDSYQKCINI